MKRKRSLGIISADPELFKKADRMNIDDLYEWADISLSEAIHQFGDWRRDRDPLHLQEALLATEAFYALLLEMSRRRPGVKPKPATRQLRFAKGRVT